jgi:hypothetical protein
MSKVKALNLVTDSKLLGVLIKSLAGRGKKYDADLHLAAMSSLFHAYEHKSTAHTESLILACAKSTRVGALKTWLMDFGCYLVKEDKKTLGIDLAKHAKGFNQVTAGATPFYAYTKEVQPASPLIAMDMLKAMIKRLESAKDLDADSLSVLGKLKLVVPSIVETDNTTANAKKEELAEEI